ncbi:MAG: ATP-dependent DNA helicase DinG [Parasphingorhabdus sp.]|jgi:ATP-dependent DNA helicase DinG
MSLPDIEDSPSAQALASGGVFDQGIENFNVRPAQQEMAHKVEDTIANGGVLIAESGTGTGKTFAYLVPALLSGKQVIVATGTRHLQDQIFLKDLPLVQKLLGSPCKIALLKGRSNYLCLHRLDMSDTALYMRASDSQDLQQVVNWSHNTRSGDISEIDGLGDSPIWPTVTSTADNCLGSNCPRIDDCFVIKARRKAASAELVVVNHHLFFSDLALKDTGFGEVLPGHDAVIFDEAHQIPEIAAQFFGSSFSTGQIRSLCREVQVAEAADKSGIELDGVIRELEKAAMAVTLCVTDQDRGDLETLAASGKLAIALETLVEALKSMAAVLAVGEVSGENLENVRVRCVELVQAVDVFRFPEEKDMVYWYEKGKQFLRLEATPISVEGLFKDHLMARNLGLIFTSATLASDSDASHFRKELGLDVAEVGIWPSPFPFNDRALMYVPDDIPEPSDDAFAARMVDAVLPVVRTTQGRAFLLFTSYRVLNEVRDILREMDEFELMVQGDIPKHQLIEKFRNTDNCLLLGTTSFWEGVDVKGDRLICVVIDKLPFASPFDPVQRARLKHIEEQGGNPFGDHQLPRAIMSLKQGAGRLIRDDKDYGVLMLCDRRVKTKNYGNRFLGALPPMKKTSRLDLVQRFIHYMEKQIDKP